MKKSKNEDSKKNIVKDSEINYSEIPATDNEFWEDAAVIYPQKKVFVQFKIDEDIAEWLKELGNDSDNAVNNFITLLFYWCKAFGCKIALKLKSK